MGRDTATKLIPAPTYVVPEVNYEPQADHSSKHLALRSLEIQDHRDVYKIFIFNRLIDFTFAEGQVTILAESSTWRAGKKGA